MSSCLQAKHPAIRRGTLPCGGANTVLWLLPDALDTDSANMASDVDVGKCAARDAGE